MKDYSEIIASITENQNDMRELIEKWADLISPTPQDVTFEFFDSTTHVIPNAQKVIDTYTATTDALDTRLTTAEADIVTNANAIALETSDRTTADTTLQTQIDNLTTSLVQSEALTTGNTTITRYGTQTSNLTIDKGIAVRMAGVCHLTIRFSVEVLTGSVDYIKIAPPALYLPTGAAASDTSSEGFWKLNVMEYVGVSEADEYTTNPIYAGIIASGIYIGDNDGVMVAFGSSGLFPSGTTYMFTVDVTYNVS